MGPRVGKAALLNSGLNLVVQKGYGAINIKAVAQEAKCSTQPISWHFNTMEGMRNALYDYGLEKASEFLKLKEDGVSFSKWERTINLYIELAIAKPKLFQFLYLGQFKQEVRGIFDLALEGDYLNVLIEHYKISNEKAEELLTQVLALVHGIAALIACGALNKTKKQIMTEIEKAVAQLIKQ